MNTPTGQSQEQPRPPGLRKRKKGLISAIQFTHSLPEASDLSDLQASITALPIPDQEREELFAFFFGPRPENEDINSRIIREDSIRPLIRSLSKQNEKAPHSAIGRFLTLFYQGYLHGLARGVVSEGIAYHLRGLRKRWEKEKDPQVIGEVLGVLEDELGPIEDPAEIPYEWVRRAILEIAKTKGRYIPVEGSGRHEMSKEEEDAIIADCKKWQPICEELNKAFKLLWKITEYCTSELFRKEKRGKLAKKHNLPLEEVKDIESHLGGPPPISKKSTPTQAMFHRVARDFPGLPRGEQTIKNVWEKYVRDNPEWGRKKRATQRKN